MVPDYDDDDIIEDYDEIATDSPVQRVSSGQGGPVKRPSGYVRPSTTAMAAMPDDGDLPPKGKITQKSARNIWIICIVITVLGVGAVIADLAFDAFGRHKNAQPTPGNNAVANNRPSMPPREMLTEKQKLEKEFIAAVSAKIREMDASKAWDYYWTSVLEFDHAYEQARVARAKEDATTEELEGAWATAIAAYYKAKYAAVLFRHRFDEDGISEDYIPIDSLKADEVALLMEEDLRNPKIMRYQAAYAKIDSRATTVNKFRTDVMRYEEAARRVHDSEEWAASHFGKWKTLFDNSGKGEFDPEHLEFVKGPDYKSGETKMWEAFLESQEGG